MIFTDTARWQGQQSPFFNRKEVDIKKLTVTKPKVLTNSFGKVPPKSDWKIPKMNGPAPGSYEEFEAIKKTQFRKEISYPKKTSKNQSFTDKPKNFGKLPGPCTYTKLDGHSTLLNKDKAYKKVFGFAT